MKEKILMICYIYQTPTQVSCGLNADKVEYECNRFVRSKCASGVYSFIYFSDNPHGIPVMRYFHFVKTLAMAEIVKGTTFII